MRSCTTHSLSNFVKYDHLSNSVQSLVKNLAMLKIPRTIQEALDSPQWKQAIQEEMRALVKNQTWEVIQRPHNKVLVGCRWVFIIKYKADGTIERYKARLVAKGYTQTYGIDYQKHLLR